MLINLMKALYYSWQRDNVYDYLFGEI